MKDRRILVVEDEPAVRRGLCDVLKAAGYGVAEAADGEQGLTEARKNGVRLVLLDLMLPKVDGMEVLTRLRRTHPTLPIIILTARGAENDRVRGLKTGADDYVVKPFSAKELLARVEAVLRRTPERPVAIDRIEVNGTSVDLSRREIVFPDETRRSLSEMESGILEYLASNPGRVVSRDELLARVWGIDADASDTRAIDMHITRLRSKLADPSGVESLQWISTVRGKGYMLAPEIAENIKQSTAT